MLSLFCCLYTTLQGCKKFFKNHTLKRPKATPQKMKFRPKYERFKISHIELFFWKHYFGPTTFLWRSTGHHQGFILISDFLAESQFEIQFRSKILSHFTNLNSLDIENNMLPKHSQKPFSLYKFFSKHVSICCQKKHLYCTISWRPKTAFLKNFENVCIFLCISVRNFFPPKT